MKNFVRALIATGVLALFGVSSAMAQDTQTAIAEAANIGSSIGKGPPAAPRHPASPVGGGIGIGAVGKGRRGHRPPARSRRPHRHQHDRQIRRRGFIEGATLVGRRSAALVLFLGLTTHARSADAAGAHSFAHRPPGPHSGLTENNP
ncbi:MAG: hypothetical protein R3B49_08480 [Phycisphaerales bacterium]